MVARGEAGTKAVPSAGVLAGGVFLAWRRFLTYALSAVLRAGSTAARAVASAAVLSAAAFIDPAAIDPAGRRTVAAAGGFAFAIGAALGLGFARQLGQTPALAAVALAWTVLWALVRLLVLLLVAPLPDARDIRWSWAVSLLPFAFGVTPVLRLVALAASARLAWLALQGLDGDAASARRAVAWAYGGQALAEVLRWAATSVLFVVPLLGR